MPQMMPMNWIFLLVSFSSVIITMIIMLYFSFSSYPVLSKAMQSKHDKFNMPW